MHKPGRFVINCKPNVNLCNMSIWVSIHIYLSSIFLFIYFCLPNKLYIIIIIIISIIIIIIIIKYTPSNYYCKI